MKLKKYIYIYYPQNILVTGRKFGGKDYCHSIEFLLVIFFGNNSVK